jgi:hypothetical protein
MHSSSLLVGADEHNPMTSATKGLRKSGFDTLLHYATAS